MDMKCPKCGAVQPESNTCIKCQVIISKYRKYLEMKEGALSQPTPHPRSAGPFYNSPQMTDKAGGARPSGAPGSGEFAYGGFWIRFGAILIDSIFIVILVYKVFLPIIQLALGPGRGLGFQMLRFGLPIAYETYFVGNRGATPGKMLFRLKVVRPDGNPLTYARAFGRYFGKVLSYLTLLIGFIMAGFDSEKRALHDRICDTRVSMHVRVIRLTA